MWNLIRKRTSLIPCRSYSVGEFTITFCFERFILLGCFHCTIILIFNLHLVICACSDWNGSKRGHVYKFLRSLGFESSYDTAHQYTDADAHKVNLYYTSIISFRCAGRSVQCLYFLLTFLISFIFWMQWVSHRNHRGNICGVDFIWLLNPNRYRKLLQASWSEAVFGMFKVSYSFFNLNLVYALL